MANSNLTSKSLLITLVIHVIFFLIPISLPSSSNVSPNTTISIPVNLDIAATSSEKVAVATPMKKKIVKKKKKKKKKKVAKRKKVDKQKKVIKKKKKKVIAKRKVINKKPNKTVKSTPQIPPSQQNPSPKASQLSQALSSKSISSPNFTASPNLNSKLTEYIVSENTKTSPRINIAEKSEPPSLPIPTKNQTTGQKPQSPNTKKALVEISRLNVTIKNQVFPKKPKEAINFDEKIKITVNFTISPSGEMIDYNILKGTGYSYLDTDFKNKLRYWTFSPEIINGKPVTANKTFSLEF
ncbi:hypothetical protein DID75_01940 [Candidatus Marinamargulisbacteria bacterium SCGC AG-410-N11]|nr:hypothetical protein DID75_01940 [Candidatus Marinamargulisbacteria bacterium SCGC AG-410-N11]